MSTHSAAAPGDAVHAGDPVVVDRYTTGARINHWITAASLVLLALSGLALFHPSLFFLSGLFGGGSTTRMIHPWIGVVLFFSFIGLFFRFWRLNLWVRIGKSSEGRLRNIADYGRVRFRRSNSRHSLYLTNHPGHVTCRIWPAPAVFSRRRSHCGRFTCP